MGYFIVENNGIPVSGQVNISGAKNAALPILAATVLCPEAELFNCPQLSDTDTAFEILASLGFHINRKKNKVTIEALPPLSSETFYIISSDLCSKMRSSIIFMAPVCAIYGSAVIGMPGGCCLGARPIDLHLSALEKMGAEITQSEDSIFINAKNGFYGADIVLSFPSVGATESIILAAVTASGTTHIFNPAHEPEIEDLCSFLNKAGAKITFGDVIEIEGVKALHKVQHTIIPDRIEAATYLTAAAITGGELFLKGVCTKHLTAVIDLLNDMGCIIKSEDTEIYIDAPSQLENPQSITTAPYPLLPTDIQPQLTALFAVSKGCCHIKETIFEGRYNHISYLNNMGADIEIADECNFIVNGINKPLLPVDVRATDLRCGAALILAALTTNGIVKIANGEYILRGYEDICNKMSLIGVNLLYKT